jgi:DNA-binding LacI/PurR family transcriptional regulator
VSRVLNGNHVQGRISPACVKKVMAAAKRVGYRPNYHARSLQTGLAHTLGLLVDAGAGEVDRHGFWSQMVLGVQAGAIACGYDVLVIGKGRRDESPVTAGLRYVRERRIDCMVVPGYSFLAHSSPELHEEGVPAVLLMYHKDTPLPVVGNDAAPGIAAAVKHLAGLGHEHLLWLGPASPADGEAARRMKAFEAATKKHKLQSSRETFAQSERKAEDPIAAGAFDAMVERLKSKRTFTGIVCYNERTAFGAYAAAHRAGLAVPGDLSVVGFDDIHAHMAHPPMTVASHMLAEIGRRAAAIAVEMAGNPKKQKRYANHREMLPSELVIRASTGRAKR